MLTRRALLLLIMTAASLQSLPAFASGDDDAGGDDSGGSGGSGSGSGGSGSGSGSSGSGSGGSGSGSGSSGSGSDDDDSGSSGGGSGSGSGNSGSGSSNSGSGSDDDDDDLDQDKARRAVREGQAIELRKVMATVRRRYGGRVVNVSLKRNSSKLVYSIRLIDKNNRLLNLVVNARTGQITAGSN